MTENGQKKYITRLLSIFLCIFLIGMLSAVAFAAEKLTATANVELYPTLSYKNADGKMYYGQTLEDALIINDDEVVKDAAGNQVAGRFEFRKPEYMPIPGTNYKLDIIFVPADEEAYTSFTKLKSSLVYSVESVDLVPVDENDTIPTALEVEAGATLSMSTLVGAKYTNPYNANEPNILSAEWEWVSPDTIVSNSGYYEARLIPIGYAELRVQVYVKIASAIPETTIAEYPAIPELTYNPNVTWADIELTGGKAVIKGTDTEVEGTFTIKDFRLTGIPNPNFTQIEVVFTPANAEEALPYEFTVPVKVNPLPISFNDGEGNFIVDGFVFEADPGTLMRDIQSYLMAYLNYPPQSVISVEDKNSYAENGRTYKLTVIHDNPNYTGSEVYFTVVFKDVELTPVIASAGYNEYKVDCGSYRPDGTFTVSCNGEEIAEVKAGQPFDCVVYTDEGGTYEITAKYNPVENDYFIVSDASYSITVNPARNIKTVSGMHFTVNGSQTYNAIRTGDVIELTYNMPEFAYYVVKDGNGKTVTLDGVDLASKKIKFTMPDFDLSFSVKTPAQLEQEEATANCDHLCHSDNPLIQMIWKLLHIIFRLFNVQQFCDCGITHYDAPLFGFIS